jgi:hypothetical protein
MNAADARRLAAAVALAVVLCGAVVTVTPTSAGANSDVVSIFEYAPEEPEASPGETVTVDVEVFAGGAAYDIGVDRVNATLAYDSDALTVTDIQRGPWLAEGDADVLVETAIDDETGTVRVGQTRDPAGEGVTGNGTLLTVTLAVAEDAAPGNYTLAYGDNEVRMVNGHFQPVFVHNGTLVVTEQADGGPSSQFVLGIATVVALVALVAGAANRFRAGRD